MKRLFIAAVIVTGLLVIALGCSQTPEQKVAKAEHYLSVGQYEKARRLIDGIVAVDTTTPEAIYGKALIDRYHGYDWEAIFKCIDASPLNGGYIPAMGAFLEMAIDHNYTVNARKMVAILIKRQPDNPQWFLQRAKIDMLENKLDDARADIRRADSLGCDSLDILLAEAEAAFRSYNRDTITAALGKLSRTRFKTADQFSRLASLFGYLNMGDSAIYYSRQAVKQDNENLKFRLQLAQNLFDELYLTEAYDLVNDMLANAKEFGPALKLRAYIEWAQHKEVEAEQSFYACMQLQAESPIGGEDHGNIYAFFNNGRMAEAEWQAAYMLAANLAYPDDYLRELYPKMENAFLENKTYDMAFDYFEEGKQLLSDGMEMIFIEAELKSRYSGSPDSAKLMVDNQIQQYWDNEKWLEPAARYFFRTTQFDQAAKLYWRLTEFPYPQEDYYTKLLKIAQKVKDGQSVDKLVQILPYRFERSRRIQENLCKAYQVCGRIQDALKYAEELYHRSPGYMPYIRDLADLYLLTGKGAEAGAVFFRYSTEYPRDPEGFYRLAMFNYERGAIDSLLILANRSLALDTAYVQALELKGLYYREKGSIDSALYYFRRAISLQTPTPLAYYYVADYFFQHGDSLSRAAGLAMAAVRYFENDRRGYLLLGNIYTAQGKYKLARSQYFTGQRLFPEDAECSFLLGKTCALLREKDEARTFLKKALTLGLPEAQKKEAEEILARL